MKVLVPVNVLSASDTAAAVDALLDRAWPEDVEFHLLNVIEDEFPGGPCAEPGCEQVCRCLEARVRLLADVMRQLETKVPHIPIFIEVVKGNLDDKIQSSAKELQADEVMSSKPTRLRKFSKTHPIVTATVAITAVAAVMAIALTAFNAVPAGGFVPVMPPPMVHAPTAVAPKPVAVVPAPKRASDDELRVEVLSKLGESYLDFDDYSRAIWYYQMALNYLDKAHPDGSKLSTISAGLSIAHFGLHHMADALKYGQLSIYSALGTEPRNYKDISVAYNNFAYLSMKAHKREQSEEMYERAFWYAPKKYVEDRLRAATIEVNLADAYGVNGKLAEARWAYDHALGMLTRELPSNHPAIRELLAKVRFLEKHNKVKLSEYPMTIIFIGE